MSTSSPLVFMHYGKFSNKQLYSRCLELSTQIKEARNQFIALIPEVNRRQLFKQHGIHTIYEFCAKLAGLSNDTVNRILKLTEYIKDKPIIYSLFQSGQIGWSKIEIIAPVINHKNEKELSNKALTMSQASLKVLVKDLKIEKHTTIQNPPTMENFPVKITSTTMTKLRILKHKLEKQSKQPLSWEQILTIMINKMEPNSSHLKKNSTSKKVSKNSRYIPKSIKENIYAKSNQMCGHNNCKQPAEVLHHQIPFAISHNHESLIPLCKNHHDIIHHKDQSPINKKYQFHKKRYHKIQNLSNIGT